MLRERAISTCSEGQRLYKLAACTAYTSSKEGHVAPLMGCECPGTVWYITEREGLRFTVTRADGAAEQTFTAAEDLTVLTILNPVPLDQLRAATYIIDKYGYQYVVKRVNPKTVTCIRHGIIRQIPHTEIVETS